MKDLYRSTDNIQKHERSVPELEPFLIKYECPYGDWSVKSSDTPFFKALQLFGRHNIDAHGGEPNVHLRRVYDLKKPKQP